MFAPLLAACAKLDKWLHAKIGRPYGIVMTVGLILEIVHRLSETPKRMGEAKGLIALVLLVLLNAALLINQLGELSERVTPRGEHNEAASG